IRSEAPSVAVLDMRMPLMTGMELMAELERGGHSIPVVAFSASTEHLEAVRHRAAAVLVKPVSNAELVEAVREALSA
ncbi:MAG: response regulator, partial [Acidobacteriota bacterium]